MASNYPAPARWVDVQQTIEKNMERVDSFGQKYDGALVNVINGLGKIRVDQVSDPVQLNAPTWSGNWIKIDSLPKWTNKEINWKTEPDGTLKLDFGDDIDLSGDPFAGLTKPTAPILSMPSAPADIYVAKPSKPNINVNVKLPDEPNMGMPVLGDLQDIKIPAFTFPTFPDFDGKAPDDSDITVPNVFMNWTEPKYVPLVLEEVTAKIKEWLKGGTGIPPEVERAMFERARGREAIASHKAIREAADEWAARGFTLPPGALNDQVMNIREQERLRAGELNRDIWIKATELEIENIRFTVQQGIALEQIWMNHFEEAAKRSFEMARFHAEAQINLFNARISLFNAKTQTFQIMAQVIE